MYASLSRVSSRGAIARYRAIAARRTPPISATIWKRMDMSGGGVGRLPGAEVGGRAGVVSRPGAVHVEFRVEAAVDGGAGGGGAVVAAVERILHHVRRARARRGHRPEAVPEEAVVIEDRDRRAVLDAEPAVAGEE